MKKTLALLLAVLMLFSLLPAQALADETIPEETVELVTEATEETAAEETVAEIIAETIAETVAETTAETESAVETIPEETAAETEPAQTEETVEEDSAEAVTEAVEEEPTEAVTEAAEEEPVETVAETAPEVYLEVSDEAVNSVEFDTTGWLWPVKATDAPAGADNKALYCYNMARAYYDDHHALDITDYTGYTYAIRAAKSGIVETVYTGCGNWNGARDGGSSCSSATCYPLKNGEEYYGKATYNGKTFCGYGNAVIIKHDNVTTKSEYAHLSSVTVSNGQWVYKGQIIGYMGSTGASTGVHLHFGIDHDFSGTGNNYVDVNNNPIGDIPVAGGWNGTDTIQYADECISHEALLYIAECEKFPTYGTVMVTKNNANINDRPCSRETQLNTITLGTGASGSYHKVLAVYKNTKGNYWYEIETNVGQPGYIYAGNVEYYVSFDDVTCSGSVPASAPLNGPLTLSGAITSIGTKLQKITVTLYQENGNKFGSITRDATEDHKIDLSTISFTGFSAQKPMKLTAKAVVNVAHYNINTEKYPIGSTRTFDLGTVQLTCVNHTYGNWTLTKDYTCTEDGEWTHTCTLCGHTETKVEKAPGHTWVVANTYAGTCTTPGYTLYSCNGCGERKTENKTVTWSGWSTEYPDTSLDRIETKTQYRYRDWTSAGQTTQTGYVDYVESWPDGFDYNNSYRTTTFAQRPKTAYENSTERLVVESDNVVGYLYWHWCRGQQLGLNYNRSISNGYTDTYWCFHAYYSTNYVAFDSGANAWNAGNYDCCQDSYWYFQLPVRRQTYRIESKTGTDGAWGSWSSWSETPVTASSTRQVETRNLYRYINSGLANHKWGTPVRTKEPTNTSEGELTYTCTVCGNKKIEILPKLQFRECSHNNTTLYGKVDPTCTEAGYSGDRICSACGDTVEQGKAVAATGHTEVTVKGKAATCTKAGKTDGKKCSVCGTVTVAQKTIKAKGHTYTDDQDAYCNVCGQIRSVPMYRMYDPNSGEHFYTGSTVERDFLVKAGWHYEGVGFNFPYEGAPVHRLYDPVYGEHLYTMDEAEMNKLLDKGWNYENVAFNSAGTDEVPQYRLHNPNSKRGAYHFTGSEEERDLLISFGWVYQGIGWYSCLE